MIELATSLEAALVAYLQARPELANVPILEGHAVAPIDDAQERYIVVAAMMSQSPFAHANVHRLNLVVTVVTVATEAGRLIHQSDVGVCTAALARKQLATIKAFIDARPQPGFSSIKFEGAEERKNDARKRLGTVLNYSVQAWLR